jgi:hypothetical protein
MLSIFCIVQEKESAVQWKGGQKQNYKGFTDLIG